jgi:hypothetical protein
MLGRGPALVALRGRHRGSVWSSTAAPFSGAWEVQYASEVPALNAASLVLDGDDSVFRSMITTKAASWAYEREWRIFHEEADRIYNYDEHALRAVYLGMKMSEARAH